MLTDCLGRSEHHLAERTMSVLNLGPDVVLESLEIGAVLLERRKVVGCQVLLAAVPLAEQARLMRFFPIGGGTTQHRKLLRTNTSRLIAVGAIVVQQLLPVLLVLGRGNVLAISAR